MRSLEFESSVRLLVPFSTFGNFIESDISIVRLPLPVAVSNILRFFTNISIFLLSHMSTFKNCDGIHLPRFTVVNFNNVCKIVQLSELSNYNIRIK